MNSQIKISSKRKLIAALLYLVIIPGVFGVTIGTILPLKINGWESFPVEPFYVLMSTFSWGFSIYFVYYYFKNIVTITITRKSILIQSIINTRPIESSEINKIRLTQKLPLSMLWVSWPTEATTIELKNGEIVVIWDDYYRNIDEIKRTLEAVKVQLKNPDVALEVKPTQKSEPVSKIEFADEKFRTFKGNLWTNFEFLSFLVIGGGLSYSALYIPNAPPLILFGLVIVLFFFTAYQQHYFKISDNHIQVKNHLIWWSTRTFRIRDIKEVSFEVPYRGAFGIKLMNKDFSTKTCLSATLKTEDFEELKKMFEKLKIKYRGEFE